jgi:hypothetical protein
VNTDDKSCHSSTVQIKATTEVAFNYLSDGVAQGDWALGSMRRERIGDHLYSGTSIFNGAQLLVRIDADKERLMIYYHVGAEIDSLQPRNIVRIVPGEVVGKDESTCLVTLLSWRNYQTDEDRWKLTCLSHETEMFIIKDRIEALQIKQLTQNP